MDALVLVLLVVGGLVTLGLALFVPGLLAWQAWQAIRRRCST